jgi:hypothetical protein
MLSEIQIRNAVDVVLDWDLPDAAFSEAVAAQARALAARPVD